MELFGTAGIRGPVTESVTPDRALAVGYAVARDAEEVVLGRDGRETGASLAGAMTAGLTAGGATVTRVGQVPTPALAYASQDRRGVMLTASHNPPGDNGIKLFVDGREYARAAEERIAARLAEDAGPTDWTDWGVAKTGHALANYRQAVVDYARTVGAAPTDLTVAVDCGNGMGARATPQVLTDLGVDVIGINANVDGQFTARGSKPTPESLAEFCEFVGSGDTDLGVAHDGDADRLVVVGGDGSIVHEDSIVAILAETYTSASEASDPVVVTTPNASGRIDERVQKAGGRVERVRLGALHEGIQEVIAAGGTGTTVAFAAEPWKHIHPDFGGWIDGVASAAVLTRLVADAGLHTLVDSVPERPYRKESVDCPDNHKAAAMDRLETSLPETFPEAEVSTEYGIRLTRPDGDWTLVRPSGTEPYLRLYAESEEVDRLVETVREAVERAVNAAD